MSKFIEHKNVLSIIQPETISIYCPTEEFKEKTNKFFSDALLQTDNIQSLYYPFDGNYIFNINNWTNLVNTMSEFIISIINIGIPQIVALQYFNKYEKDQKIVLSFENIIQSSKLVLDSWNLCTEWYNTNCEDKDIRKKLVEKLKLLEIDRIHYDILGCLQIIRNEILFRIDIQKQLKTSFLGFPYHENNQKRLVLLEATKVFTRILSVLETNITNRLIANNYEKLFYQFYQSIYKGTPEWSDNFIKSNDNADEIPIQLKQKVYQLKNTKRPILLFGKIGHKEQPIIQSIAKSSSYIFFFACRDDKKTENIILYLKDIFRQDPIRRPGYLKASNCSMVFLQDIEILSLPLQVELYQMLKDKFFNKIQLIASTTKNLKWLEKNDNFYQDLLRTFIFNKDILLEKKVELNKYEYELCVEFQNKFGLFTRSKAMIPVLEDVKKYAQSSLNILILGETGTGKELIARAIHGLSSREGEFQAVNCSSIPKETFEGEVFGYKKGAFTGANKDHKGYFEQVDGGTLFLDEIGEIPPEQQAKLLRAIEYKEIQPLGSEEAITVDVRIVAATNADLEKMITNREFREDLYYRIADSVVKLPSLSDRKTDIPPLSVYLFEKALEDEDIPLTIKIKPEYFEPLMEKEWKGNIRDLWTNIRKLAANFKRGNQTVERLKSLISGTDTETKRDNSIFEND
ncbi:MAG: sigma-54-dependent Fis family transcriptional regulator, partial [Spirochaetes bacterium]|nr:sigma-54-dependent Fis family transcriptional regulator [Spirochaetota bacterium]